MLKYGIHDAGFLALVDDVLAKLLQLNLGRNRHLLVFASLEEVDREVVDANEDVVWVISVADAVDVAHIVFELSFEVCSDEG